MAKIKTDENESKALDQDQTDGVSCISSSRAMWRNIGSPSLIQWPRLNGNNLHSCVSLEALIEDQRMVTPNFPYKLRCSSTL